MKVMLMLAGGLGLGVAATFLPTHQASAQEGCMWEAGLKAYELDEDGITALYDCISDDLAAGYAGGDNPVAAEYRSWGVTATGAAAPGAHSDRMLLTFANDVAFDTYVEYGFGDDFAMPVGSVLAKESFSLRNNGAPRPGPFFIMTKVAAGEADEFDNWVYGAVQPNGNAMRISQSFCHDCHVGFADQDNLGYPASEVRLGQ